ncbi:methyltransferase domain-containing protein [Rhizobium glycinendophyticum]|uniref:Methyltransferase domain-containing protein n=1 Tax=Rhizobium glycinendophyticum TaxID=2589807 RepID=A0A504UJ84_9HYPH|nr:methyltransferase domain-containing protein [Rhizobium glycinendophyticum]TPP06931.1 methyltransferase domain-containing protein [Rhizobium glycinendophyticum]
MNEIFDEALIARNRGRAWEKRAEGADFLLELTARELGDRLSLVERRFDKAAELFGATGVVAQTALATGKIGDLERIETNARLLDEGSGRVTNFESVPLEPQSVNLILSPLSLHLTNDTPGMLIQMRRALKPDGLLLAAIPGAGTLAELRDVLLAAETEIYGGASPRVVPFADIRDIGALMQRSGFALPVIDEESFTVRYDHIFALMRDLKAMGMANPLIGRSRKPVSRRFFMRAAELYAERYADPDGRIRATFSIIFVSGWAPHESQQKPLKPGSAKMRLADALDPNRSLPSAKEEKD